MYITKWKTSIWKGLSLIPTIWLSGTGKTYEYSKKFINCQELMGKGGYIGGAQRIFRTVKQLLYVTVIVDIGFHILIQTRKIYNMKN